MGELKPCPFCGNKTSIEILDWGTEDDNPNWAVTCCVNENSPVPQNNWAQGCGATGGYKRTEKAAIEAWNKRV